MLPADVAEPPADWKERIVHLLEACRIFHLSNRAFGTTSTLRWRLHGPALLPWSTAQYRELGESYGYYHRFVEHSRCLKDELAVGPVILCT